MATVTEVRVVFTLGTGRVVRPSFYIGDLADDSAVAATELQGVAEAAAGAVSTSGLMASFPNSVTFRRTEAQNFRVAPPGTEEPPDNPDGKLVAETVTFVSDAADIVGTAAGDALPPNNAMVFMWTSTTAGTGGRNWSFWPTLSEDDVNSDGLIELVRRSTVEQDIEAVISAAALAPTPDASLVVCSRKYNRLEAVAQSLVQPHMRTQRVRYAAAGF